MKTYTAREGDIQRRWLVVDAAGKSLGRLASHVATVLRGKHKPPALDVALASGIRLHQVLLKTTKARPAVAIGHARGEGVNPEKRRRLSGASEKCQAQRPALWMQHDYVLP